MPARSIAAKIEEWVADEVQKQSFTDDVGWIVYPVDGLIMVNGQPPQTQTHWRLTVTMQTGLLGANQKVITNHHGIEKPDPKEDEVRAKVAASIEELRQFRTKVRAPQNGHGALKVQGRG